MTIGKYNVIYADPPWRYAQKGLQGAAERHYPTMGIEELCALPVADLAAPEKIVALMGDVPRVELFARQTAPGWDVWGNEVEPTEGLRDILSQRKGG